MSALMFDLGGLVCRFLPERRLAAFEHMCGLPAAAVHQRLRASGFSEPCDHGAFTAVIAVTGRYRPVLTLARACATVLQYSIAGRSPPCLFHLPGRVSSVASRPT